MGKLLFITQKIDKDDDVLGVYHRWVEELSKKIDKISVICLYRGRTELPMNVQVFSLGKDKLPSGDLRGLKRRFTRIKYVLRFYKYVWNLRGEYETVFVHMNPIYTILGGIFWKLNRKRILLWYNHPLGNLTARFGVALADKVFCTSPYSFSAKYKKTFLMPAGIDTDFFKKNENIDKKNNRILYLGRISPIKHIDCLIKAGQILDARNVDFEILIIGSPSSQLDKKYEQELKKMAKGLVDSGKIIFKPSIPNHKTPDIYNSSQVFINLTPTGSLDKTTFEAMACGLPVLVSNKAVEAIIPRTYRNIVIFKEESASDLAEKIIAYTNITNDEKENLGAVMRRLVLENHSLVQLVNKLVVFIKN